jgi:hypothetical protein
VKNFQSGEVDGEITDSFLLPESKCFKSTISKKELGRAMESPFEMNSKLKWSSNGALE